MVQATKTPVSKSDMVVMEGSKAIAEAVKRCRVQVVSAYPITPQTHIVEALSQMVADGDLKAEFVNVESEHSAASVVCGASATGARVYTASSSQGLALMSEVLFNIAGLRLPVILTCANRALSSPLNIWNDQQDSLFIRDSGCIQIYAEDTQEAIDLHVQAYKIAEDHGILLPILVCMDGFLLTHAFEPLAVPSQEQVDAFLPPYKPMYYLTTKQPITMGAFTEPDKYTEARYMLQQAMDKAKVVIESVSKDYEKAFGRHAGGLVDEYRLEDADIAFVAMGSILGTLTDVVDELRHEGRKVGILKVKTFRPFPKEAIAKALRKVKEVVVLERGVSIGGVGILTAELQATLYGSQPQPKVRGYIVGLGGRDVPASLVRDLLNRNGGAKGDVEFAALNKEYVGEE